MTVYHFTITDCIFNSVKIFNDFHNMFCNDFNLDVWQIGDYVNG